MNTVSRNEYCVSRNELDYIAYWSIVRTLKYIKFANSDYCNFHTMHFD